MFASFHFRPRKTHKLLMVAIGLLTVLSGLSYGQRTDAKELYGATSPVWSPDGQHVAYVIQQTVQQQNRPDLYLFDVGGSTATKLAENASGPTWSPDGQKIAYTGYDGSNETINFIDVKSRKSTQLTIGYDPAWSPNGKHLAYLVGQTLHMANADGAPPRRPITDSTVQVWSYGWSPDGSQIAFVAQGQTDGTTVLYVSNPDGSALHKIADSTYDASLAWSPNSKQLLLVGHCGDQSVANLCVVNSDGSSLRHLATQGLQPVWSPDGRQILFTLNSGLCVIHVDGSNPRCLTKPNDPFNNDFGASWSPDSHQILFVRMHNPQVTRPGDPYLIYSEVYMMNADGSNLRPLPDGLQRF
ncbi:MAG: TolB family protein [Aggregatilineales bacterium]